MEQLSRQKRGEPSLRDAIAESGETAVDPTRSAFALELEDRRFLGREFLTWLIYHADDENGGGQFAEGKSGEPFRIIVGERVVLKALGEGSGEISARGVAPATTPDVRYAIAGGLTVREVDLIFEQRSRSERSERLWQAAVSAEGFDLRRVKLPALLSEEDDEKMNERLALLDELERMLQAAFDSFLRTRLQPTWQSEELPRLRAWLAHSILEERQLAHFESDAEADGKSRARRRPVGK